MSKKILFITWDGPYVNYLETLFLPIFKQLSSSYEIHIIQFSWQDSKRKEHLQQLCVAYGIKYVHRTVFLKPWVVMGKYFTVLQGAWCILSYVRNAKIDYVMPRSTLPARMLLMTRFFYSGYKLIYDADGLPIEERVEFANLNPAGIRYRLMKRTEHRILQKADRILARTMRAIAYLAAQHKIDPDKFYKISNGKDSSLFQRATMTAIQQVWTKMGASPSDFVMVYVGSLGPQYGVEQMVYLYRRMKQLVPNTHFWLITTNPDYMLRQGIAVDSGVKVLTVNANEVPLYLSAATVGLAIRKSSPAMSGVAPIKLGEYLLVGLPVVASAGIGDTDQIFSAIKCVHVLANYSHEELEASISWMLTLQDDEVLRTLRSEARELGLLNFSLAQSCKQYQDVLNSL